MPRKPIDENDQTTYVTCAVCGEKKRRINYSHTEYHGMSVEEYKTKFPGEPLVCKAARHDMSVKIKKMWKEDDYVGHTLNPEDRVKKPVDTSHEDNFVTCAICGKKCRSITWNHTEMHGLSLAEYKAQFPSDPTESKSTKKKHSEAGQLADQGLTEPRDLHEITDDPRTYVECLVCGGNFRQLNAHLAVHGVTPTAYKEEWPGAKLVSDASNEKLQTSLAIWRGLNPAKEEARLDKIHAARKGKKNRPDHKCRGWGHVWDSFDTVEERDAWTIQRYRDQAELAYTGPRGCILYYTDRKSCEHTFKSRHELAFAISLDLQELDWNYEPYPIKYIDTEGKPHQYLPDFDIPDLDQIFEVKPFGMGDKVKAKIKAVMKVIPHLILVVHKDIDEGIWGYVKNLEEGDRLDFTQANFELSMEAA